MRRIATFVMLLLTVGMYTGTAFGSPISITNHSFETQVLAENGVTNNSVSGWTDTTGCSPFCFGVFNPGPGNVSFPTGFVPDGNNAAYMVSLANVPLTQTLSATLAADTIYTLTIAVGNPADRLDLLSFGFELGLVGSAQNIISFSAAMNSIPNGLFTTFTASSTVLAGNPDIGKTLVIRLFGPNNAGPGLPYIAFDNVQLDAVSTAVPEPATYATMLVGLSLLGLTVQRRNQRESANP